MSSSDLLAPNDDLKKDDRALYAPKRGPIHFVSVPALTYLALDGPGDPNISARYTAAVTTLFATAYAIRSAARRHLERVHTVSPLEGLWSAEDPASFVRRDKSAWEWTILRQPVRTVSSAS